MRNQLNCGRTSRYNDLYPDTTFRKAWASTLATDDHLPPESLVVLFDLEF